METRVNVMGRNPKDPHAFWTEAQLKAAGFSFPETPGEGPLADVGLKHHSIRPEDAPPPTSDGKVPELTPEQMQSLDAQLTSASQPEVVKPKDLECG